MNDDPDDTVPLVATSTAFEAEAIVAILSDAGIRAMAVGTHFSPLGMGLGLGLGRPHQRVTVEVRERELDAARRLLQQRMADSVDIDWDAVDLGEREDNLPLNRPGRLPWPVLVGYLVAVVLVGFSLVVGTLLSLHALRGT
ncbi:MAG: DUF2007 domain-containing protein [Phycisphaerales bacterium]|nr:DUF2007 domain-containing protein [Phycisphaerales bacterium]